MDCGSSSDWHDEGVWTKAEGFWEGGGGIEPLNDFASFPSEGGVEEGKDWNIKPP